MVQSTTDVRRLDEWGVCDLSWPCLGGMIAMHSYRALVLAAFILTSALGVAKADDSPKWESVVGLHALQVWPAKNWLVALAETAYSGNVCQLSFIKDGNGFGFRQEKGDQGRQYIIFFGTGDNIKSSNVDSYSKISLYLDNILIDEFNITRKLVTSSGSFTLLAELSKIKIQELLEKLVRGSEVRFTIGSISLSQSTEGLSLAMENLKICIDVKTLHLGLNAAAQELAVVSSCIEQHALDYFFQHIQINSWGFSPILLGIRSDWQSFAQRGIELAREHNQNDVNISCLYGFTMYIASYLAPSDLPNPQ